jgi:MtrB/PioB family decaheme-associated outer membrane protein
MKKTNLLTLGTASICSWALIGQNLYAADEMVVTGDVSVAVQDLQDSGDRSNLEKYRDGLDDRTAVEKFNIQGVQEDFHFAVDGRDIGQKDQFVFGEVGKFGKYRVQASWDETPRNYGSGVTLNSNKSGYWAVPDALQGALESNFTPLDEQPSAANQAVLLNALNYGSNNINMSQERETGTINVLITPARNLNVSAGYAHQTKDGSRPFSTGSYRRSKLGAEDFGGVGENFRLYGLELPAPVDNETNTFDLGLDYHRDNWFTDFSVRYVDFSNNQDYVTWDNPLLLTGQDNEPGGSALNRLDQAPDYDSLAFNFTGGIAGLPLKSRFTATLSQDTVSQDDDFLAYTVNTAVLDADGNVAATRQLPANDLDGDVTTTFANVVLSSRPLPRTSVNLRYKYYDYSNDSKRIDWDGWVRIAEVDWKAEDYTNRVPEYEKNRYGIDGTYRISSGIKFKAEAARETYDRNKDRNADTEEDIFNGTVQFRLSDWGLMRVGYTYKDRSIDGGYTAEIGLSHEWDELRMFDQADRERQIVDAYFGWDASDKAALGFSLTYNDDEYDDDYYGLHDADSYIAGVDFSYQVSDTTHFSVYYSREDSESNQLNRTKSDNTGNGAFEVPQNDWKTQLEDTTDAVGFVLDAILIPDKLDISVSMDYSKGEASFDTQNTNYVAGITTSSATAYPWSDVESEITEFKVQLNYHWTEQLETGFRYYYNELDLDDFATDEVVAYSGTPADQQGNTPSHFVFMDANQDDYDAHFFVLSMTYSFE